VRSAAASLRRSLAAPVSRLPIRLRLAGTSGLLTFLILCAFAASIGTLTARRIRSDFTHQVAAAATDLRDRIRIVIDQNGNIVRFAPDLDLYAAPEHAVARVVTVDGQAVEKTLHAPNLGAPFAQLSEVAGYRVETRPLELQNGDHLFVQYARRLSDLELTISRVRLFLLVGVLGGTGLAFGAGAMIARRAMAPIAELTAAAREIERTRDPTRSIPAPASEDEVAELARTLEGMLRALSDARAETEAMLTRQREFVADASHELRTPLTSVLANLELLAESLRGDERKAAHSALRSSQRMRRLVADLLLLARADIGRERARDPLDLADVVLEAAAELEPVSGEHQLEIDAQPAPLIGAADELHRVVINLVENALRHTPPGTHVLVTTATLPDGRAQLAVSDDGPGIAPDMVPQLFERFVRGSGDTGGSFGLGLAIVQAVADAHGGDVRVEEPEGGGARFVVTFPASPEDAVPGSVRDQPLAAPQRT
jgi:signal transduction histidine kinase